MFGVGFDYCMVAVSSPCMTTDDVAEADVFVVLVLFVYCAVSTQVCLAAVGLTGDICRGLSNKVLPYCDDIMVMLLENLGVSTHSARVCNAHSDDSSTLTVLH